MPTDIQLISALLIFFGALVIFATLYTIWHTEDYWDALPEEGSEESERK